METKYVKNEDSFGIEAYDDAESKDQKSDPLNARHERCRPLALQSFETPSSCKNDKTWSTHEFTNRECSSTDW